ncbi:MAG: hypothetical protein KKE02_21235 [Alphaproteobacteria bacterium]|nr:hypothetical protein [Alphaproteobacteria bacterium]MBU1514442.1 hypothetical protein [Alphaproteobacteria bacterium]MBU2097077.1 hypothetical protein [Alphaproteobacteria bacterium]MBU2153556.1 hypothetical protein [Alphaproteobacteria bacterium]MBU2308641.1 hypothetical protein [Alphaproteobacteria bacterium]
MSEPAKPPTFAAGAILALVLVGIVAAAALAVLSAYAPDLRSGQDGRAHALSKSAIGYAGAPILMKALGASVLVSRTRPVRPSASVVVLTPEPTLNPDELRSYPKGALTLIVLPKWAASRDPIRQTFVRKAGVIKNDDAVQALLKSYAPQSRLAVRKGVFRPTLHGVDGAFADVGALRLGRIDGLRTLSGQGWIPLLADEAGNAVLVQSAKTPSIWVLSDPDLLNNHGLASRDTARVGALILETATAGERPILFDVTLNGFERGRGMARLMLEPPWLAATLIAAAAGILMGLHALARFGQPRRTGRAFALGARALVDNSADLVRMARKEHELAPAYAALTRTLVARAAGGHTAEEHWLDDLARRRGAAAPSELAAEADTIKTRDELTAVARKLYDWRGEMTRERR